MKKENTASSPTLSRARFRLLAGGPPTVHLGPLTISAAPGLEQPFPVTAIAYEEDTFLVLSAPPEVRQEQAEHPVRLFTALWGNEPLAPGSVMVQDGKPLRLLAVVHDLNAEPSWREEWVTAALEQVLATIGERRIAACGMELLATRHGRLPEPRFLALLGRLLAEPELVPGSLQRLWLITAGVPANDFLSPLTAALDSATDG